MNLFRRLFKKLDDLLEHVLFDVLLANRLRLVACLLVGAAAMWMLTPTSLTEATRPSPAVVAETRSLDALVDRPWFDGYPVNPTPERPYHAYLFTSEGYGIFITLKSRYTQEMELFYFKLRGDQLQIYLPETKTKATGKVAISECSGPGDFDLKMSLGADPKNEGKAKEYFSWQHWGKADVTELLAEVHSRVRPR